MDWAALALLAYEVPSILFSQYRANSIGATEVVAVSVPVYFATRLLIRAPLRAAWLAALLGLCGAWLAYVGIHQFIVGAEHLAAAGLTDFVAFRALFIHPVSEWVSGENFTLLLLTLPFACAAGIYLVWRLRPFTKKKAGFGLLALLPAACIVAVLLLSLSRSVFWSTLFFFIAASGLMAAYRVVTLRAASFLLAGCCGALLLVLACEAWLYLGIFRTYSGNPCS